MAKNKYGKKGQTGKWGFKATDTSSYHDLYNGRGYYQQQQFDIDTEMALEDYVNPKATAGSQYNPAQQLNHAMKQGIPLTANQQFMKDAISDGMHNLGYNVNLTRYARVDFLENLGIKNYSKMTESQLQQALVGRKYVEDGFISTSYNEFKNAPNNGAPFTDKAVKINYKAPASTQALMPMRGGGGDLGEIVLGPSQHYEITGVRFTGNKGRSGAGYYDQVEIDVQVK